MLLDLSHVQLSEDAAGHHQLSGKLRQSLFSVSILLLQAFQYGHTQHFVFAFHTQHVVIRHDFAEYIAQQQAREQLVVETVDIRETLFALQGFNNRRTQAFVDARHLVLVNAQFLFQGRKLRAAIELDDGKCHVFHAVAFAFRIAPDIHVTQAHHALLGELYQRIHLLLKGCHTFRQVRQLVYQLVGQWLREKPDSCHFRLADIKLFAHLHHTLVAVLEDEGTFQCTCIEIFSNGIVNVFLPLPALSFQGGNFSLNVVRRTFAGFGSQQFEHLDDLIQRQLPIFPRLEKFNLHLRRYRARIRFDNGTRPLTIKLLHSFVTKTLLVAAATKFHQFVKRMVSSFGHLAPSINARFPILGKLAFEPTVRAVAVEHIFLQTQVVFRKQPTGQPALLVYVGKRSKRCIWLVTITGGIAPVVVFHLEK